jgi:hypothetical protein
MTNKAIEALSVEIKDLHETPIKVQAAAERLMDMVPRNVFWALGKDFVIAGGALRDLIRGRRPNDLDVWIEGDPNNIETRLRKNYDVVVHASAYMNLESLVVKVFKLCGHLLPEPLDVMVLGEDKPLDPALIIADFDFTVNAAALLYREGKPIMFYHHRDFFSHLDLGLLQPISRLSQDNFISLNRVCKMIQRGFQPSLQVLRDIVELNLQREEHV